MKVKELKKLIEKMEDEREIVFNMCDGERVESSGSRFLGVYSFGDGGYMLEILNDNGIEYERDEDDEDDFDDIS